MKFLKYGILLLLPCSVFGQGIEWIHQYVDGNQGIVEILSNGLVEYHEKATNSPPQLVLTFPTNKIIETNYDHYVNIPPLYRIEANEKLYEKSEKAAEVILYFSKLPKYKISTIGENLLRISWVLPESEEKDKAFDTPEIKFDRPVTLNFKDADLVDLLRVLAKQNNLNIIAGQDIRGEVTLSLTDVHLGMALDAILKVNKYDWFIQGNIIVIKSAEETMPGELTTRVYKLNFVDASAIEQALTNVMTDKGKVQGFSPTYGSGSLGLGFGSTFGAPGTGGSVAGGVGLGTGSLSTGLSGVAGGLGGGIGGVGGGSGVSTGEYVLITEVYSNFPKIEKIIEELDVPIPQVNISVKFIETKLAVDERLGINWKMRSDISGPYTQAAETATIPTGPAAAGAEIAPITETAQTEINLSDVLNVGKYGDLKFATLSVPMFYGLLEILSTDGDTRLIQEPQVTTKNNTLATVTVGTTFPVLVPQTGATATEGTIIGTQTYTFEEQQVNISLNVKPRINADKYISMSINATVQAIVGMAGPNADRPIISDRTANTQVMVGDGETLLIGGLIYDQVIENKTTLPLLDKIPLLNKLFIHKTTTTEQRELLIFITPNIVNAYHGE